MRGIIIVWLQFSTSSSAASHPPLKFVFLVYQFLCGAYMVTKESPGVSAELVQTASRSLSYIRHTEIKFREVHVCVYCSFLILGVLNAFPSKACFTAVLSESIHI